MRVVGSRRKPVFLRLTVRASVHILSTHADHEENKLFFMLLQFFYDFFRKVIAHFSLLTQHTPPKK